MGGGFEVSDGLWLAASGILTALIVVAGGWFQSYLTAIQLRDSKAQDYARQDAVAAKADRVVEDLHGTVERVAEQAAVTSAKLDQIHELVNSNLFAQMQEAHSALVQQSVLMQEVIALHTAAGRSPSPEALEAVAVISAKAAELGAQIRDRAKATVLADAKVKP
jgi:hypothetical protein